MVECRRVDRELRLLLCGVRVVLVALVVLVGLGLALWSVQSPRAPGVGRCTPTATGTICSLVR